MYYTLVCFGAALLCACVLAWVHSRRARACFAGLPSYPALPLLGNVYKLIGGAEAIYHLIVDVSQKIEDHQKPFVFWFGPLPALIISDPEDVKLVTNSYIEKPLFYNFGRIWLGDGLVTASGTIWKRNIKKLAGTFIGPIVHGYQGVFNAQAQKMLNNLKREVGGAPFDIMQKYLAFATLESICQTALGFPSISDQLVTTEYYEAFTRTLELLVQRGINPIMHPDWLYRMTPAYRELVKNVAKLHDVSNTVIAKKRKELNEMKQNGTYEEYKPEKGRTKFRSFLDILLEFSEADPSMSEEQIRAEVDTIIVGGQETTATSLMYTILELGSDTRVQEKMFAELQSIFGDSRRPVEKEDLARMTYCEAVINEALRLYPPAPVVMREATYDLKLSSCTVPKGTACVVNAFGAGRSCRSWGADAHEFKPERWLDGSSAPPAAFLPFSYGKRSCIGKKYAMALLKTLLAYCVRELIFVSNMDQLKYKVDIALKPISGHFVQLFLSTERPMITYWNPKYISFANFSTVRYGRRNPVYYVEIHWNSLVTYDNNVTGIPSQYRRSFLDLSYKWCHLVYKDQFFGPALRKNLPRSCPHKPGPYHFYNMSANMPGIPDFPFVKGRIYCNISLRSERVSSGYIDMEVKRFRTP